LTPFVFSAIGPKWLEFGARPVIQTRQIVIPLDAKRALHADPGPKGTICAQRYSSCAGFGSIERTIQTRFASRYVRLITGLALFSRKIQFSVGFAGVAEIVTEERRHALVRRITRIPFAGLGSPIFRIYLTRVRALVTARAFGTGDAL
jgi:hypothetical protein